MQTTTRILLLVLSICSAFANVEQFDITKAREMLYFSYASYCPSAALKNWTCFWCKQAQNQTVVDVIYDQSSNSFGYVGYTKNEVVVSFRGTVLLSLRNWIKNLQFATTQLPSAPAGVEVHIGFLKTWITLKNGILVAVRKALERTGFKKISINGHSLGGAIATLAALDLYNTFYLNASISVWTFGSPRVGETSFSSYFNRFKIPTIRMVNNLDIVPHVPPQFVFDYRHVPTEIWYDASILQYFICDNSGEDPHCSDSITIAASFDDHLSYLQVNLPDGIPANCGGVTF